MRVGVLGSTGFVGTNLMEVLTESGISCIGGSRRLGVDATNTDDILGWIKDNRITHIVNLAAECGGIGLNQVKPADLWLASTRIPAAVLEASRIAGLEKLVMIGTVCCYAKYCPAPFKEDQLMHHGMPEETNRAYGVAKLNALVGAQSFSKQYGLITCNLIPVNMYGPHDHFDTTSSHVIPALIRKFSDAVKSNDDVVTVWGTGNATREFLYVRDFAKAVILALHKLTQPDMINIGTGSEISIRDLAGLIASIVGFSGTIIWDTSRPDGQPRRCLDVSKANSSLGFVAETSLQAGLVETINWYNREQ